MDGSLRQQFLYAIMRLKKTETLFSSECEMQMNELVVLQSITGHCACHDCASANLDVPDIQEKLQITKPAVSYILNALEKKRYICRGIDPKDRRKISITPTSEGQAAADQANEKFDEVWCALLDQFGEADMCQLVALLTRLLGLLGEIKCDQ